MKKTVHEFEIASKIVAIKNNVYISFLFNILFAFIVTIFILFIMFQFFPKNGSIQCIGEKASSFYITSNNASIELETKYIKIDIPTSATGKSNTQNLIFEQDGSSKVPSIIVNSIGEGFVKVRIDPIEGKNVSMSYVSSNKDTFNIYCHPKISFYFSTDVEITFYGLKVLQTSNQQTSGTLLSSLTTDNLYLECDSQLTIPHYDPLGDVFKETQTLNLKNFSIDMVAIKESSFISEGEINLYYSQQDHTYPMKNRFVNLFSKGNGFSSSFIYDGENSFATFNLSGEAERAYMDNSNLFPTFRSWILNNVFVSPLAFFSTIFAAITLTKRQKA